MLKCGKEIKETVKWLKAESQKCPFCGTLIDTTEFRRELMRLRIALMKCFRTSRTALGATK
jgi:hypothetical protein